MTKSIQLDSPRGKLLLSLEIATEQVVNVWSTYCFNLVLIYTYCRKKIYSTFSVSNASSVYFSLPSLKYHLVSLHFFLFFSRRITRSSTPAPFLGHRHFHLTAIATNEYTSIIPNGPRVNTTSCWPLALCKQIHCEIRPNVDSLEPSSTRVGQSSWKLKFANKLNFMILWNVNLNPEPTTRCNKHAIKAIKSSDRISPITGGQLPAANITQDL